MVNNKKVVVLFPAYNAEKTIRLTYSEIPFDIVDEVVCVDDGSSDRTFEIARELGIKHIIKHNINKGYGANQKTCFMKALELDADIIVMVHPDYQYTPKLIHSMVYTIANGVYPVVLGSRILGKGAIKGGMPVYKYIANRILTIFENLMINQKLSEYHTGFRAFSKDVINSINYHANSNDFIFDNQVLVQVFNAGFQIGEITCPTKYFTESSSISFLRSVKYGFEVVITAMKYRLHKWNIIKSKLFT